MMKNCAILLLLCVLHIVATIATNDELTLEIESDELMKTGDLEQAETKEASATEIIKQIRKLNPDGTFTIGFESVSDELIKFKKSLNNDINRTMVHLKLRLEIFRAM